MSYKKIEASLRKGSRLHAFRSGGGLRVVRVENKRGKLIGYGEDPHIYTALQLAEKSINTHGGGHVSEFLTGSSNATSDLDAWILAGHTFDAWFEGEELFVELLNPHNTPEPSNETLAEARKNGSAKWSFKDHVMLIFDVCSHREDPCCYKQESITEGTASWFHSVAKTGRGKTLKEALDCALAAPLLEKERKAT